MSLPSGEFEAIFSFTTNFPEENTNGIGLANPESRGIFVPPSTVVGRPDITGYVLTAVDNSGKVEWAESSGGDPGAPNNSIQYNDNGSFAGSPDFLYNGTNVSLNTGNIVINAGGLFVTGGNILVTGGDVTANNINANNNVNVSNDLIVTGTTTSPTVITTSLVLNDNDTNTITVEAPVNVTGDYQIILPPSQGGANTYLENDGAGNLSWQTISTSSPGGVDTSVQFNNAGAFGGSGNFTYDGTDVTITGGDLIAVNVQTTSDIKLKRNVEPIKNALSIVKNINGYTFNWENDNKLQRGVIAQQLEEIGLQDMIKEVNGIKTVNYNQLLVLLLESIKELAS